MGLTETVKRTTVIIRLIVGVWVFVLLSPVPAVALGDEQAARKLEALDWYSEEYPPYNYKGKDGLATGMAVDILMAALKKTGANIPLASIKIVPWNESYKRIQRNPGTALFSMTYTPERRQIMKFVGPSIPVRVSIIALKSKHVVVKGVADLSTLKIGVVRDDIGDQLIRNLALSDESIFKKDSLKQLIHIFLHDRVDAIAYASNVFKYKIKQLGEAPELFEEAFVLKRGQLGYAFHHLTPSEVLAPLQAAIDSLRADGTISRIISSYSD